VAVASKVFRKGYPIITKATSAGTELKKMTFDCEEQRLLVGFVYGSGDNRPRNKITKRKTTWRPNHANYGLKRIASNLFKIRHWQIIEGDYTVRQTMKRHGSLTHLTNSEAMRM
jgi:hypothetical protein